MKTWEQVMDKLKSQYIDAIKREIAAGLHPVSGYSSMTVNGLEVQKPDGSMAMVGEQMPTEERVTQYYMYGEQGDEPPPPTREQVEAWAARNGMVLVPRAAWADACAMPGKRGPEPAEFPADALRPLHGEKWR